MSNMCSIDVPYEPILVGPIDGRVWAAPVRAVVGEYSIRAGQDHGLVDELARRLLITLASGEGVYAACTGATPTYRLAVVLATDRRLLVAAGGFDRWHLDAPWSELDTAAERHGDRYELVVRGLSIQLTGAPRLGAARLHAYAQWVLDQRQPEEPTPE